MEAFSSRFPIFSTIFSQIDLKDYAFIFVYHLNDNNAPFLEHWIKQSNTPAVISIPYSEIKEVKEKLTNLVPVITPQNTSEIPDILLDITAAHEQKNIILIEIGGYSSTVRDKLYNVILTVEDTNQGHWAQESTNKTLRYPIVSIAQAEAKMLENRMIGESIVTSIEKTFKHVYLSEDISNKTISVLAYGGIGSSVCLALRKRNIFPFVYDVDSFKTALAHADGYKIASRDALISNSDIIIGCSGKSSITLEDALKIKKGAILFSGSSKQVEFAELLNLKFDEQSPNILRTYNYKSNSFSIAYDGQPINFLDSVKPERFEIQLSLFAQCVFYGLTNVLSQDIHSLPFEYQLPILELYLQKNYQTF